MDGLTPRRPDGSMAIGSDLANGHCAIRAEPIKNVLTALPSWGDAFRWNVVIINHGSHLNTSRQVGVFRHAAIERGGGGGLRMD